MELASVQAGKSRHFTSPPKAYTEDTLLSAMETAGNKEFDADTEKKGLGTPATRANIIEKLVHSGYAARKGKQIVPTKDGMEMISVIPDYLKSAALTAEWRNRLLGVERGKMPADAFLQDICKLVAKVLEGCDAIPEAERQRFDARVSVGNCPLCGKPVYESVKKLLLLRQILPLCALEGESFPRQHEKDHRQKDGGRSAENRQNPCH